MADTPYPSPRLYLAKQYPSSAKQPDTTYIQANHPLICRFWGFVHHYLRSFSHSYRDWVGIPFNNQVAELAFGLILKWSDSTRLEEVLTMQVTRKAGLPVPNVICFGDHPDTPHALVRF